MDGIYKLNVRIYFYFVSFCGGSHGWSQQLYWLSWSRLQL